MKKIITALLLVIAFTLSGCGCSTATQLSFSRATFGENSFSTQLKTEKRTYSVELDENYVFNDVEFKKNKTLIENDVTYSFENGSYVTELSVISKTNELPFESDLLNAEISSDKAIIHYQTRLNVTAKYSVDEFITHEDYVYTDSYFLCDEYSYAPLYSCTESKNSHLNYSAKESSVKVEQSKNTIVYQKDKYTVTKLNTSQENPTPIVNDYGYTFRTLVDNSQLLFVLRNFIELKEVSDAVLLPTVSYHYGDVKNLSITYEDKLDKTCYIDGKETTVPTNAYSFVISSTSTSCVGSGTRNVGREQLVFIQNAQSYLGSGDNKTPVKEMKADLVEYAEPLTAYGQFYIMGALVYKLTSII